MIMYKILFLCILLILPVLAHCQSAINSTLLPIPDTFTGPLIVGHRGGFDVGLPENSVLLFDHTLENACRTPISIEFDVRKSASGSLYIMHDETVDRTTNGSGKISNLPDNYIDSLRLKDRSGTLTSGRIPLFIEILQHYKTKNIILMLDVKGPILTQVIKQVQVMQMESKCILLTFTQENTKLAMQNTSTMMISALVQNRDQWNSLLGLNIPPAQLIAYINKDTPDELLNEISARKVLLMTDMSESIRNNSSRFGAGYYTGLSVTRKIGVIITDYPLYVNSLFCN
jgi:glycerophosphoryl diester phosphodiesterase